MHQMDMPIDYHIGPYGVQCWNATRDFLARRSLSIQRKR